MARYLLLDAEGEVITAIEWDGEADLGLTDGRIVVPDDGSSPITPVPESVTNYQARSVLIAAGLFERADAMVRASGDQQTIQAWDYANSFYRDSPFISAMAGALGLSDRQTDDLFRQASTVR